MSQPNSSPGGGQVVASWQELARLPQMLGEVKTGIMALRALISTPAAAMATGSPAAGAAIVGLGAELLVFLAQTVQAIDDDIEAMTRTAQNYQQNEAELTAAAGAGQQTLAGLSPAMHPTLNGGVPSCTARGALTGASMLDDVALPAAALVRTVGNASQYVLDGAADTVEAAGRTAANAADALPYIPGIGVNPRVGADGPSLWGGVLRSGSAGTSEVLRGVSDAVETVEVSAASTATSASRIASRADDLLTLDGSCSPGTVASGRVGTR